MEHFRVAERALVSALVLGAVDRADLAGRVRPSDFTDPAAEAVFEAAVQPVRARPLARELPAVLREQGRLRRDGYPVSRLVEWLPQMPTPVHPQAWATLVVAGAIGRQVRASGERLQQSAEAAQQGRFVLGRVLATVAAQRAAVCSSARRWQDLPAHWRAALPPQPPTPASDRAPLPAVVPVRDEEAGGRQRVLLAGLVAAPQLLGRIPWLREDDFTDPACGAVFGVLRRLHEFSHPVDVITLSAACPAAPFTPEQDSPAELARRLQPAEAFPSAVPFLARQVLELAISRDVHAAGQDLVRLAEAPPSAGGLGSALLAAAQDRLNRVQPHAVRWESATRDSASRAGSRTLTERPARVAERSAVPDRDAG